MALYRIAAAVVVLFVAANGAADPDAGPVHVGGAWPGESRRVAASLQITCGATRVFTMIIHVFDRETLENQSPHLRTADMEDSGSEWEEQMDEESSGEEESDFDLTFETMDEDEEEMMPVSSVMAAASSLSMPPVSSVMAAASAAASSLSMPPVQAVIPADYTGDLRRDGFVVVPCLADDVRSAMYADFLKEIERFPEFKQSCIQWDKGLEPVMGGFAALGNPASFHNPTVRRLRLAAQVACVTHLGDFPDDDTYNLEQIIDRMLVRGPNKKPTEEAWHRDIAVELHDGDIVFGGWINLTTESQTFSCAPGTHDPRDVDGPKEKDGIGFATLSAKAKERMERRKRVVEIPPGCMLVFYESIAHEVVATQKSYPIVRLFTGWRFTRQQTPLVDDILRPRKDANKASKFYNAKPATLGSLLEAQAVMPLKSGQMPPMYAALHWTNHRGKIVAFSRNVIDRCRHKRKLQAPKADASQTVYDIVQSPMLSLREYGLPMYAPYTPEETALLTPARTWTIGGQLYALR